MKNLAVFNREIKKVIGRDVKLFYDGKKLYIFDIAKKEKELIEQALKGKTHVELEFHEVEEVKPEYPSSIYLKSKTSGELYEIYVDDSKGVPIVAVRKVGGIEPIRIMR